jgi:DNA helicase-2/ATP-dependent DNA helicase PcrA
MDTKEDRVTLMTANSAKGLEFDCVIVAGVEDGLFPYRFFGSYDLPPAKYRKEMEEECRLLYVAMTRARERLLLTAARSRRLYDGSGSYRSESPFIMEASPAVISRSDVSDDDEEHIAGGVREAAPAVHEEDDGLKVGDRVLHQKYGTGRVLKVTPGDIDKITVKFSKGRIRLIVATFLERI